MKKNLKKLLAAILTVSILATFCVVPMTVSAEGNDLKFGSDGKFKIVVFSDVQENPDDPEGIQKVVDKMSEAIETEKPDLVVFTGDQTELNIKDVQGDFKSLLQQLLAPVVEANVPYSFVFGNHDFQSAYSGQRTNKDDMLQVYQSIGDCRTYDADPTLTGTGTCKIPVYSSDGSNVLVDLFMVDSNTYMNPITGEGGYDNPHADQMAWIAANKDSGAKSILFQHIPMPEIYNLVQEDASGEKSYGGKTYKKALVSGCSGALGEFPCPCNYENNTGEFAAIKEMGDVLGVVTGHDHLNDFSGTYDGVTMTAVPGMTYFNYADKNVRAYGVIELDESDLTSYSYHSVKLNKSPYALNVDFSGGNCMEQSGNATYIANSGAGVTYKYDETLKKMVAVFDGNSGYGYTLSNAAKDLMRDGYTYEILYKLPAVPGETSLASGMYSNSGFGLEYTNDTKFTYWQSLDGDTKSYRQLWYKDASIATNQWIHIVATWNPETGSNGRLLGYLNGNLVDEANPNSNVLKFNANGEFYIGGNSDTDGSFRDGTACEIAFVRIYDKIYTGSEMPELYSAAVAEGEGAVDGQYYPYDEISFDDLWDNNDKSMYGKELDGTYNCYTYNATSASKSVKFKFRWTPKVSASNDTQRFTTFFDAWAGSAYPFCLAVKSPNYGGLGKEAGPNGAWHIDPSVGSHLVEMDKPVATGESYDIEFGRLKVMTGDNAGKYYVYVNVNGDTKYGYYYDGVTVDGKYKDGTGTLTNRIIFSSPDGNKFKAVPPPESFDTTDEIYYSDLYRNGSPVPEDGINLGKQKFTYNKTSSSSSAVIKLRWKNVNNQKNFYLCFDAVPKTSNPNETAAIYAFAIMYSPGKIWLGIGNGKQYDVSLTNGADYDIEFGRRLVVTGDNQGKYKLSLKITDALGNVVLFEEKYLAKDFVDENGQYVSNTDGAGKNVTCSISNEIYFSSWGSSGDVAICDPASAEVYDTYDEVYYSDLSLNGNPVSASGTTLNGGKFSYTKTSPSASTVLKLRWKNANASGATFYLCFDAVPKTSNPDASAYIYAFGLMYSPSSGFWLSIGNGERVMPSVPMVDGNDYDIEFARLLVVSGKNAGKYKLYLKVSDADGNVILYQEKYLAKNFVDANGQYVSNTDGAGSNATCSISNQIMFSTWGGGSQTFCDQPYTFDTVDQLTLSDLGLNPGNYANSIIADNPGATYSGTSASHSFSLRFYWEAHNFTNDDTTEWMIAVDDKWNHDCAVWFRGDAIYFCNRFNDVRKKLTAITSGKHEVEFGRKLVVDGAAKGKYYVYLKIDGAILAEGCTDGYTNGYNASLSNLIYLRGNQMTNQRFADYVEQDVYESYDEIGYTDLTDASGNALNVGGTGLNGGTTLKYNMTSESGSVIFKYRWRIGDKASFQMSFDGKVKDSGDNDAIGYRFGAWLSAPEAGDTTYPHGKMWLRPGYGPQVDMPFTLAPGSSHNVEFARLKVASGKNAGKYKVYIKIDDTLVAEDYVAADVVNNNTYETNPAGRTVTLNNEIFFAFWGTNGNAITAYKETIEGHEGTVGDFDGDGFIGTTDLVALCKVLLGTFGDDLPTGIGDYNNDTKVNLRDLLVIKKTLAGTTNIYAKSGSLVLGTQEHLNEDATKTADYIADASAALGATAYRLSASINTLFYANSTNGVVPKTEKLNALKAQVAALKAKGIDQILYVTDAYVLPYGYSDPDHNHNKTVPDPVTDKENYEAWLTVNSNAFTALAQQIPDIKFFEPFNEINVFGARLEKYGIGWSASEEEKVAHRFSSTEKAAIMADLCWNVTRAVKSVNPANQVTTPSIALGGNSTTVDANFFDNFYKAIESGAYPSNKAVGDKRVDNFFTIVNIHSYPDYSKTITQSLTDNWAQEIVAAYNVVKAHNDGNSRVWLTETGISSNEGGGASRDEEKMATVLNNAIAKIDGSLTYVDTIFIYKVADISTNVGNTPSESAYGLFYSGDDEYDPYGAKLTAKAVYSYFHGGSTDYSAIDALVSKYAV